MYWTNLLLTAVPAVLWVMCDKVQHIEELNDVYECVWERVNSKKCTAKSVEWSSTPFTAHHWSALHSPGGSYFHVAPSQRPPRPFDSRIQGGKIMFSLEREGVKWGGDGTCNQTSSFPVMEQEMNELEVWCSVGPGTSRSSPSPRRLDTRQRAPGSPPSPGLIDLLGGSEGSTSAEASDRRKRRLCIITPLITWLSPRQNCNNVIRLMTYRFSKWVMGSADQQTHASLPTIFTCCWKFKESVHPQHKKTLALLTFNPFISLHLFFSRLRFKGEIKLFYLEF